MRLVQGGIFAHATPNPVPQLCQTYEKFSSPMPPLSLTRTFLQCSVFDAEEKREGRAESGPPEKGGVRERGQGHA